MKFHVAPAEAGVRVPPHPLHGPIEADGSHWLADQYTLRLILDGIIRRIEAEPSEAETRKGKAPKPTKTVPEAITADRAVTDNTPNDERAQGDALER